MNKIYINREKLKKIVEKIMLRIFRINIVLENNF
jgi:hypothetical protein